MLFRSLWDNLESIYDKGKKSYRVEDFKDLANKNKSYIRKQYKEKTGEPEYDSIAKVWDEISFVRPAETEVERMNRTYQYEKDRLRTRIIMMREKMKKMYDYQYPIERRVMEQRLNDLERDYYRFDYLINPYHIQPGLLLDVDITSIKRKKATLDSMANVLNEFLHGVSKGFQDAAFASFSRRRSTVRQDINQSFSDVPDGESHGHSADPGAAYLDMINAGDKPASVSDVPAIAAPAKKGRTTGKGMVDAKKPAAKRGTAKKASTNRRGGGALKEI